MTSQLVCLPLSPPPLASSASHQRHKQIQNPSMILPPVNPSAHMCMHMHTYAHTGTNTWYLPHYEVLTPQPDIEGSLDFSKLQLNYLLFPQHRRLFPTSKLLSKISEIPLASYASGGLQFAHENPGRRHALWEAFQVLQRCSASSSHSHGCSPIRDLLKPLETTPEASNAGSRGCHYGNKVR